MLFLNGSYSLKRNVNAPELAIIGEAILYRESENTIKYYERGNYTLHRTK
jgi:hypothetical protein